MIRQSEIFAEAHLPAEPLFTMICNASGVPVAAGILGPSFGVVAGPIFAAFAMGASSVSVVVNELRLGAAKM